MFRSYLNSYGPSSEPAGHDTAGDYVDRNGPEEIVPGFSEFLGYFMPRKVMAGQDTMRAAGTVTRKLAAWLAQKGYIERKPEAEKQASRKGSSLVKCRKVERILDEFIRWQPPVKCRPEIEDHFRVERIEPGRIWLLPLLEGDKAVGPIEVPEEATAVMEEDMDIGGVVGKCRGRWYLLEIWNISPPSG